MYLSLPQFGGSDASVHPFLELHNLYNAYCRWPPLCVETGPTHYRTRGCQADNAWQSLCGVRGLVSGVVCGIWAVICELLGELHV